MLERYANAVIAVFATVLEDDGGCWGALTTAASTALADAGIDMHDIVVGCEVVRGTIDVKHRVFFMCLSRCRLQPFTTCLSPACASLNPAQPPMLQQARVANTLLLDPCGAENTKHVAHMALALMPTRNLVRTGSHRPNIAH